MIKTKLTIFSHYYLCSSIKVVFLFSFVFLFASCKAYQNNIANFERVDEFRAEEKYMETISILNSIIDSDNCSKDDISKSHFIIADILLNDFRNYDLAVNEFNKVIKIDINNEYRKKSFFMIGYIYHNNLHQFSDALLAYENFKAEYPDDELIVSVDYEIELINKILK